MGASLFKVTNANELKLTHIFAVTRRSLKGKICKAIVFESQKICIEFDFDSDL